MAEQKFTLRHWFVLFEIPVGKNPDGSVMWEKHLARSTGVDSQDKIIEHVKMMHPGLKVLDVHPLRDMQELYEAADELRKDSNWLPMNNAQLAASARNAILDDTEPTPAAPPAIVIPGQAPAAAAPIVQPSGLSAPSNPPAANSASPIPVK